MSVILLPTFVEGPSVQDGSTSSPTIHEVPFIHTGAIPTKHFPLNIQVLIIRYYCILNTLRIIVLLYIIHQFSRFKKKSWQMIIWYNILELFQASQFATNGSLSSYTTDKHILQQKPIFIQSASLHKTILCDFCRRV